MNRTRSRTGYRILYAIAITVSAVALAVTVYRT